MFKDYNENMRKAQWR